MSTVSNNTYRKNRINNRGRPYSHENDMRILQLLSKGYAWREIGNKLGRSRQSVSRHYNEKLKHKWNLY